MFQERYNVVMASSLSTVHSNVTHKARLMNPSVSDVSINQDVIIGTAEFIVGDPHVLVSRENDEESNNVEHVLRIPRHGQGIPQIRRVRDQLMPEHIKPLYESTCVDRTEDEKERIATTLVNFQDAFSKDEYDL